MTKTVNICSRDNLDNGDNLGGGLEIAKEIEKKIALLATTNILSFNKKPVPF